MSGLVPDFGRLQTKVNQSFILGNPTPPDMSQMDTQMLKAASPRLLNLLDTRTRRWAYTIYEKLRYIGV